VHAVGEHEVCLVVFQIERIELLHADPLLRLRPPIESSLAADRIDRGEGGGRAGPVLWLSDYDRGEGVESGRLGTERRVGQEDAGEGLGDRDEGESAQGHRARARRRRRADPVVGARRDADSPGMREQGGGAAKFTPAVGQPRGWQSAPGICILQMHIDLQLLLETV
jgi:hypothetical protein